MSFIPAVPFPTPTPPTAPYPYCPATWRQVVVMCVVSIFLLFCCYSKRPKR